jgi:hypothetical protein
MAQSELAEVIEEYHRAIDAIVTGDPEPQKRLWSRGDDVTLALIVTEPPNGIGNGVPSPGNTAKSSTGLDIATSARSGIFGL